MMTIRRASASVRKVNCDPTKLGRFCWTKLGCTGKTTHVMTVYMPHNKENAETKDKTVWDQHKTYYTGKGIVEKTHATSCLMTS